MSSREGILGRVRVGLQRNAINAAAGREVMAAVLSSRRQGPKPVFDCDEIRSHGVPVCVQG